MILTRDGAIQYPFPDFILEWKWFFQRVDDIGRLLVSITVQSPHSGRPVKVRDEDVGRAVRDEAGRIFYVLSDPEGGGYFGSRTRSGKQRTHAATLDRDVSPSPSSAASEGGLGQCHDATGERRSGIRAVSYTHLTLPTSDLV